MNRAELDQIKERLLADRNRILAAAQETLEDINNTNVDDLNDEVDIATAEQSETISLRLRDREASLLSKIDETLARIEDEGEDFGHCEICGAEIGVQRLLARPVATMCIQCKERQEKDERGFAG
ncbi:MAG: TraR/DksA C4-type zinc finger protein [Deltaproteobacteria bacterium]|nr:TraR/DksA C4-type zinc finger protein [bacterium]MCB9477470.1 TraR/DksA C4-type zinc finger protein [Deltaproteobacteria bacterium]MCB9479287.1 TraR/DksA C4-type zinc finger protein [Deltaproteobacteria bacterium]MCB9488731.1 TraR/DksA C4-type zinc finger protein [Deltaproteobacteria bacterium]